ncbi:MAG: hypothetical protein QOJ28_2494, partial [Mycobacterium sp.]|nr:hypothetical protein [Mycobacterium sp.]
GMLFPEPVPMIVRSKCSMGQPRPVGVELDVLSVLR